MVYEDYAREELMNYTKQGVDTGVRPINILINDYNATIDMYKNIDLALKGEKDPESLGADKGNYENILKIQTLQVLMHGVDILQE